MRYLIWIFCGFAMFVACGGGKSEVTSSEWRLVSVVAGDDLLTTENLKKQSTLKIETDGAVHGQGGCNSFSGLAVISGATIKFDKLVVTQMACLDMKIETAFLDALKDSDSFAVESGNLKLKKDGKVIATFSAIK
ncbi:MAG: META domain-containing protein [Prevotellaceae bacterium]|nr:META domain-containing protein [Prevotellaceae bacterium]